MKKILVLAGFASLLAACDPKTDTSTGATTTEPVTGTTNAVSTDTNATVNTNAPAAP